MRQCINTAERQKGLKLDVVVLDYADLMRVFNKSDKKNPELEKAEITLKEAQAVKLLTEAQYSAMQGGATVAQIPQVAPIADVIMENAGYQTPETADDPNYPFMQQQQVPDMPVSPNIGSYEGINTNRVDDNV